MEIVNQIFAFIGKLFEWWFTVMPWEQAVFVRAGKNTKVLGKGIYFKIPFVDRVYIQQIRMRMVDLPVQTMSTLDGKTITIKAIMGYSIKDIYKMFNSISHPEMTLSGIAMGKIAEYISQKKAEDLSPAVLDKELNEALQNTDYGIGDLSVKIQSWADVKTYRLIQDSSWMGESHKMDYMGENNTAT